MPPCRTSFWSGLVWVICVESACPHSAPAVNYTNKNSHDTHLYNTLTFELLLESASGKNVQGKDKLYMWRINAELCKSTAST